MCRLLCVRSQTPFPVRDHLEVFAKIARTSQEYQGHGWGCAWLLEGAWNIYHDIRPIWEDDLGNFGETTLFLAHARSAFRDEGICLTNNMPFYDGEYVFIFNGELQGVRIREEGRIGAEKVFNYIKRFSKGDMLEAINRGIGIIEKRTRYVRAMNFIMASVDAIYLATLFSENPDYFQMHRRVGGSCEILCSSSYPGEEGWKPVANRTIEAI